MGSLATIAICIPLAALGFILGLSACLRVAKLERRIVDLERDELRRELEAMLRD